MAAGEGCAYFLVALVLASSSLKVSSAGGVVNITANATCISIDCQIKAQCKSCENAIDGNRYSTSWRYVGAAVGGWMQIVFDKTYVVSSLLIALPFYSEERHFKNIKLTFSDTSEHMITLTNKNDGYVTETFTIDPPRLSSSIRLSVLSAYNESGKIYMLNEVQVYGSNPEETTSSSQTTTISTGVISSTSTSSPTTSTPPPTTSTPSSTTSTPSSTTSTSSSTTSTSSLTTSTSFPTTSTATTKPSETVPPATTSTSTSTATNSLPSETEATTTNNTPKTNTHRPDSKNLWKGRNLYILLAAAVAAAMLILILVIVCSRKKTQTPHDTENGLPPKLDEIPTETESSPQSEAPTEPVASDTEEPTDVESVEIEGNPIEVDQLAAHVAALRNHQDDLENEFSSLPSPVMKRVIRAIQPEVKHKNRFRDILPYDDTRVPLTPIDIDPTSDYINANYINGYNQPKRFIAAQGPNDFTVNDFWRMVWEQGSTRMLMLANVVESGKKKVAHYWPEDEGDVKRFGDIEVIHIRQESWPDFVIRTFQIKKGDDERMVNHYHFTTWPDRGAPAFASGLINYYFKVESYNADEENPITVHCSAGVGRTGTYIALDWLMRQAAAEGVVDIFKCVATMRTQRMYMVQTKEQYEFIHMSLMEAFLFGGVTIPCANFKEKFEQLQTPDDNGKSKLDAMYEVLQMFRLTPTEYPVTEATAEGNVPKNRCPNVVAGDVHRPHLNPRPDYDSDYVNAVYVDGHRKQNTFFATQMPLPDTRVDLWRLVEDHECIAIVMLNELQPEDESALQYWPVNDGSMSLGPFTINNTNLDDNDGIITTDLEVTSDLTKETPLKVKHIRVVDWPNTQALPSNSKTLLRVFQNLMKWRKQNENKPVLVHCWCGEMRCGMFCCLANVWEKINEEQEVDVFNVVRQIRMNRPEFVVDEDQYKFLYQFAQDYIESQDIYANFQ